MSEAGHDKTTLKYLCLQTKDPGKDGTHNQPLRYVKLIYGGRFAIRQAPGESQPIREHPEFNLAVPLAKQRGQNVRAEGDLDASQGTQTQSASSSSSAWTR